MAPLPQKAKTGLSGNPGPALGQKSIEHFVSRCGDLLRASLGYARAFGREEGDFLLLTRHLPSARKLASGPCRAIIGRPAKAGLGCCWTRDFPPSHANYPNTRKPCMPGPGLRSMAFLEGCSAQFLENGTALNPSFVFGQDDKGI